MVCPTCASAECAAWWRRKRDSNPRASRPANGFQDRRFQPLTHSSGDYYYSVLGTALLPQNPIQAIANFAQPIHHLVVLHSFHLRHLALDVERAPGLEDAALHLVEP